MRNFLLALSLSALAPAQRTWIVDAAGGAGVHFLDIPPAVAAAADGDTIVVRAATSSYQVVELTKALRIVGLDGPRLAQSALLHIRNIGAGKTLVFSRFVFDGDFAGLVDGCAGVVLLSGLSGRGASSVNFGLRITRSAAVSISDCRVVGTGHQINPSAVQVVDSSVHFTNCFLQGADLLVPVMPPAAGLRASRARVVLNGCTVLGGRMLSAPVALAPAMVLGGVAAVTGRSTILGPGALAIEGDAVLALDPQTTVFGAIDPRLGLIQAQVPASSAGLESVPPGSRLVLRYEGLPGDLIVQGVGLLHQPVAGPFGEEWLDPAGMLVVDARRVGATGHEWANIPLPFARGALSGLTFAAQALVLRGRTVSWSTPATFVPE